jgi:aspartyl/glutamyl-tRNA(Asn/Gln) amidotransferase C subunit
LQYNGLNENRCFTHRQISQPPFKKRRNKKYEEQLSSILEYIEKLKRAKTDDVLETSQVTNLENITKNDATTPSLSQDEALANTKSQRNGLFKVKAIFE